MPPSVGSFSRDAVHRILQQLTSDVFTLDPDGSSYSVDLGTLGQQLKDQFQVNGLANSGIGDAKKLWDVYGLRQTLGAAQSVLDFLVQYAINLSDKLKSGVLASDTDTPTAEESLNVFDKAAVEWLRDKLAWSLQSDSILQVSGELDNKPVTFQFNDAWYQFVKSDAKASNKLSKARSAKHVLDSLVSLLSLLQTSFQLLSRDIDRNLEVIGSSYKRLFIHKLPTEVLRTIMRFAAGSSSSHLKSLSHVNKSFRDIALGMADMWAVLASNMLDDQFDTHLERSKNSPLSIQILGLGRPPHGNVTDSDWTSIHPNLPSVTPLFEWKETAITAPYDISLFLERIVPLAHRWRELTILYHAMCINGFRVITQQLDDLGGKHAASAGTRLPLLKRISVMHSFDRLHLEVRIFSGYLNEPTDLNALSRFFLNWNTPALCEISVDGFIFPPLTIAKDVGSGTSSPKVLPDLHSITSLTCRLGVNATEEMQLGHDGRLKKSNGDSRSVARLSAALSSMASTLRHLHLRIDGSLRLTEDDLSIDAPQDVLPPIDTLPIMENPFGAWDPLGLASEENMSQLPPGRYQPPTTTLPNLESLTLDVAPYRSVYDRTRTKLFVQSLHTPVLRTLAISHQLILALEKPRLWASDDDAARMFDELLPQSALSSVEMLVLCMTESSTTPVRSLTSQTSLIMTEPRLKQPDEIPLPRIVIPSLGRMEKLSEVRVLLKSLNSTGEHDVDGARSIQLCLEDGKFARSSGSSDFTVECEGTENGGWDMLEIVPRQLGETKSDIGQARVSDWGWDGMPLAGSEKAKPGGNISTVLDDRVVFARATRCVM